MNPKSQSMMSMSLTENSSPERARTKDANVDKIDYEKLEIDEMILEDYDLHFIVVLYVCLQGNT